MRLVKFSNIGNFVFSGLLLATTLTSAADAQSDWYDGWTDPSAQAIAAPFTGVANQQFFANDSIDHGLDDHFFKNNSAGNGLDHPFFDDSGEAFLPLENKSKTIKPMFGIEAVFLSRSDLDDVDFVFDDNELKGV